MLPLVFIWERFVLYEKSPLEIFRQHGGYLRMSEALSQGISRYMLYSLRDRGLIEQVSRGVYRLAELPPLGNPDLVTVALRSPNAVISLVSALAYHGLTTQIPHEVTLAVPRNSRVLSLDFPPIRAHKFSEAAFQAGIEEHQMDGVPVRIYNPEKTLADCFKFRNKIGMDIFLEALKLYKSSKQSNLNEVLKYARICRVEKAIRPYLEATL
jgi:predicted transcriptional regulator of viral defense system